MKFLILLFAILIAVQAHQSQRYLPNSADPEKPGYCLHKELKLSFKEGDTVKPTNIDECVAFNCLKDGLISISDCPQYPTSGPCTVYKADYTKPYPDCCAYAKCH